MKTIGLVGGMSWESTAIYYRVINERVRERLGGLHSAPIVLCSVDFAPLAELQHAGRWREAGEVLVGAARTLEAAGAEFLVVSANTMHKLADVVAAAVALPLLHVVDVTAAAIRAGGARRVGLLGTRFTMEEPFFRERLEARHGIEAVVPDAGERAEIHRVIYDELCVGVVSDESRAFFCAVLGRLAGRGAEGVILGCTELGLIVSPADSPVPLYDTALLHATGAADHAIDGIEGGFR